ncbi:MAG TPA: hypothetical protein VNN76_07700 [Bacteroidota bacterium]|nr:hypothetical protein [Bacteroidota bacterium]
MNSPQSSPASLSPLSIIFYALLASQLIFAAVVFFLTQSENLMPPIQGNLVIEFVLPVVIVLEILLARFLSARRIDAIRAESVPQRRMELYRTAFILKVAMLEGAGLLALVGYLLSQNLLFLAMFLLIVLVFLMNRPTTQSASDALGLSESQLPSQ